MSDARKVEAGVAASGFGGSSVAASPGAAAAVAGSPAASASRGAASSSAPAPGGAAAGGEAAPAETAMRRGKWTQEEQTYADFLISLFTAGTVPGCEDGVTLRAFLAKELRCERMRISKKLSLIHI